MRVTDEVEVTFEFHQLIRIQAYTVPIEEISDHTVCQHHFAVGVKFILAGGKRCAVSESEAADMLFCQLYRLASDDLVIIPDKVEVALVLHKLITLDLLVTSVEAVAFKLQHIRDHIGDAVVFGILQRRRIGVYPQGEVGAISERAILDLCHRSGDLHVLQSITLAERVLGDGRHTLRQHNVRQRFAVDIHVFDLAHRVGGIVRKLDRCPVVRRARVIHVFKIIANIRKIAVNKFHAFAERDRSQVFTTEKQIIPDRFHAVGDGDRGHRHIYERFLADGGDTLGDHDLIQRITMGKGTVADGFHAVGDRDRRKTFTTVEHIASDGGDILAERNVRKRRTLSKQHLSDLCHAVGNDDLFQVGAQNKHAGFDRRHTVGDHDTFHRRFAERRIADHRYLVAAERLRDHDLCRRTDVARHGAGLTVCIYFVGEIRLRYRARRKLCYRCVIAVAF